MAKKLILTPLGKIKAYNAVSYVFKGVPIPNEKLVSIAFKKNLEKKDYDHLYFLPHTIEDQKELIIKTDNTQNFEIYLTPSLVPSNEDDSSYKNFKFNANYNYIQFIYFLKLVDFYLNHQELEEIYLDISGAFNLYNDSLKEAVRNFKVFSDLFLFSSKQKILVYLLFSDPVLGPPDKQKEKEYQIYIEKIPYKAWFSSPIKYEEIKEGYLRKFNLPGIYTKLLKNFYRTYNSIYSNYPLIISTFGYDSSNKIMENLKNLISHYLEYYGIHRDIIQQGKYRLPENPKFLQSMIQALALYYNIAKNLEELGVKNEACESIPLEALDKFNALYSKYYLMANSYLLNIELESFKYLKKFLNKNEHLLCIELESRKNKNKKLKRNPNPNTRNFKAHAGLEYNITFLEKKPDGVYIGYEPDSYKKVELLALDQ